MVEMNSVGEGWAEGKQGNLRPGSLSPELSIYLNTVLCGEFNV